MGTLPNYLFVSIILVYITALSENTCSIYLERVLGLTCMDQYKDIPQIFSLILRYECYLTFVYSICVHFIIGFR